MVKPIDIFGLKNYRIFDDQNGFLEEFAAINILTGANNSGKSSVVKALQMLKNSAKGYPYPFDLDLNQQEHLLGDFNNILFDKTKKQIDITLPFLFFGITNLYVSLSYIIPQSKNPYHAKLRSIEVFDKYDKRILFSFRYREANDAEKASDKIMYEEELKTYELEAAKLSSEHSKLTLEQRMLNSILVQPPDDNPLVAYVDYTIDLERLKEYFSVLQPYYAKYLGNKSNYDEEELERLDEDAEDRKQFCIPSVVFKGFKQELDPKKWEDFIEKTLKVKKEITGQEPVGERDFDQDDYFLRKPEIEHNLYHKALNILRKKLVWEDGDNESTFPVMEQCFNSSWDKMIQRISAINYISNIKEENARGYNAASTSPFISLLKAYLSLDIDAEFLEKYLKAFEIGNYLIVDYQPMYQLILVSINTLDGKSRELVDFGYGIKQIILILIQVTVLARQNKRVEHRYSYGGDYDHISYEPSLLIIEEPESNLHPKWQSLLADMLSEANRRFNVQLIIETHSEYLIRKFQTLVAKKTVKSQEVKIFYLRSLQNVTAEIKQVESLNIQEDGSIDFNAFDSGFFDENYKLNMSLLNVQRDKFYQEFEDLKNTHQASTDKLAASEAQVQEGEDKLAASEAKVQQGEDKLAESEAKALESADKLAASEAKNLEDENKLNLLQQKIDEYIDKSDIQAYQQTITTQFPNVSKLDSLSVEYMVGGQYLLAHINDPADFSPVIMQYGRAVENELKQIFNHIDSSVDWMIGPMQKCLERLTDTTVNIRRDYQNGFNGLSAELTRVFNGPGNLRIDLIDDIREIRNSAGHAGQVKSKQDAIAYIQKVNQFLTVWTNEKK